MRADYFQDKETWCGKQGDGALLVIRVSLSYWRMTTRRPRRQLSALAVSNFNAPWGAVAPAAPEGGRRACAPGRRKHCKARAKIRRPGVPDRRWQKPHGDLRREAARWSQDSGDSGEAARCAARQRLRRGAAESGEPRVVSPDKKSLPGDAYDRRKGLRRWNPGQRPGPARECKRI